MLNILLPVPHFEQSRDGACLPACVRMVLAFYGDKRSEMDVATQLESKQYGAPISAASRIARDRRYFVTISSLTEAELKVRLSAGTPVIARVWTAMLPDWQTQTSHVVVVIGYTHDGVFVNDPAFREHPRFIPRDAFLAAWAEFDETAVLILQNW
jgi:ABC-type bacteriocin/lantibiotic exporter with double-glycine peptidase domain